MRPPQPAAEVRERALHRPPDPSGPLVAEYTDDANVIAAAMMHDVLEDTDVTAEEMRRVFGDKITDFVLEVTDVSRPVTACARYGKRRTRNTSRSHRRAERPSSLQTSSTTASVSPRMTGLRACLLARGGGLAVRC